MKNKITRAIHIFKNKYTTFKSLELSPPKGYQKTKQGSKAGKPPEIKTHKNATQTLLGNEPTTERNGFCHMILLSKADLI